MNTIDLINRHRSIRKFKDLPIEKEKMDRILECDVRVRDTARDRYETREYEEQGCTDTGRNDFLNRIIFHIYFSPLIPKLNKSPSSTGFL